MSVEPALSVIIPSFNTRDLTLRCVESVLTHARQIGLQVLVIDNASRDGSADAISERFPEVVVHRNATNVGFARAINQGLQVTGGDFALLLNSDAYVTDNALERMTGYMREHPRIGALGCRVVNPDGSHQPTAGRVPTLLLEISDQFLAPLTFLPRRLRRNCVLPRDFRRPADVDWVAGSCLLLRREALDAVGPLDEQFVLGEEDIDLGIRLRNAGWHVVYYPGAEVVHVGGQSRRLNAESAAHFYMGRYRLFQKHFGAHRANRYRRIMLASMGLRWLASRVSEVLRPAGPRRSETYAHTWSRIRRWP